MTAMITSREKMTTIYHRFERLYGDRTAATCMDRFTMLLGRYQTGVSNMEQISHKWSEKDVMLITYGDMVSSEDNSPLETLHQFAKEHLKDSISLIHILPFFPYSSDDGFSVIDYRAVNESLGTWSQVEKIADDFGLMFDLVLNHCSRKSDWFEDFVAEIAPAGNYFITIDDPDIDLSQVTRPRTSPLLTKVKTRYSEKWVWTTFSSDQIDLDFSNPDVLFEFLDILLFYLSKGATWIRLDAIAYLWKIIGTSCIHLPQTHEVVKLFRDLLDMVAPSTVMLSETNVPHKENISYFGNGDEAHAVYQFTLPPLLFHALLTGDASKLTKWASELSPPPPGVTYLNFTASHDGIGVRPLQEYLSDSETEHLLDHVRKQGGHVSCKTNSDGTESPYELNITYFAALGGITPDETAATHVDRFLCSQSVMLTLRGVPAVYFNSLIGAANNTKGVEETGRARTINREKWNESELAAQLCNPDDIHGEVFNRYRDMLRERRAHPAFHPDGKQRILSMGDFCFAVERTAPDGSEKILAVHNFTPENKEANIGKVIAAYKKKKTALDFISGEKQPLQEGQLTLAPYQMVWLKS